MTRSRAPYREQFARYAERHAARRADEIHSNPATLRAGGGEVCESLTANPFAPGKPPIAVLPNLAGDELVSELGVAGPSYPDRGGGYAAKGGSIRSFTTVHRPTHSRHNGDGSVLCGQRGHGDAADWPARSPVLSEPVSGAQAGDGPTAAPAILPCCVIVPHAVPSTTGGAQDHGR